MSQEEEVPEGNIVEFEGVEFIDMGDADEDRPPLQPRPAVNQIGEGTVVHQIKNLDLAIALISIGVPMRKDPPYTAVRMTDDTIDWTFNFEAQDSDGQFTTAELVDAFRQDMKFIEENPVHPMTFVMCALKNRHSFLDHMARARPYVPFKYDGGATMYVVEGSKKHQNMIAHGYEQCDPPLPF